ncbi:MAG TPA: mycothiol system anti-sigma-R factor [Acidimicrobiales bacterium]|nr:mycothiol system anti-sigma-R factor [Acidimicrobiales bacterium]
MDNHEHANCDDARHTLYEFLDGELTPEVKLEIQHHLEACAPCFEKFDFEAELLQIISRKCQEPLPDGLTEKILAALRNDGGTQVTF